MDEGEDKEENNAGEVKKEAPAADDQETDPPKEPTPEPPKEPTPEPPKEPTPEPPKDPTPDPTPKSPTPAPDLSSPKSTTPAPEAPTLKSPSPQKTPSRSITSGTPAKTPNRSITTVTVTPTNTPSLSKSVEDKVGSKSTVRLSEKIDESQDQISEKNIILQNSGALRSGASGGGGPPVTAFPASLGEYGTGGILKKRSPFIHDPPQPEERRARFPNPRTPREYIINLREDLADFQETHGLPRTRDYSFLSLGLALAQETARAIYSVLLMFAELFPILAIVSLILRFALDKLIEILETSEPVPKLKKSVIFIVEMVVIVIPLWILIGSIVIPLISLIFSMFTRMLRLKKGKKKCSAKSAVAKSVTTQPQKAAELPYFLFLEILCLLEKWCLRLEC